ncbi:unnamed protein product [Coccothraustes coccothraustes]
MISKLVSLASQSGAAPALGPRLRAHMDGHGGQSAALLPSARGRCTAASGRACREAADYNTQHAPRGPTGSGRERAEAEGWGAMRGVGSSGAIRALAGPLLLPMPARLPPAPRRGERRRGAVLRPLGVGGCRCRVSTGRVCERRWGRAGRRPEAVWERPRGPSLRRRVRER